MAEVGRPPSLPALVNCKRRILVLKKYHNGYKPIGDTYHAPPNPTLVGGWRGGLGAGKGPGVTFLLLQDNETSKML